MLELWNGTEDLRVTPEDHSALCLDRYIRVFSVRRWAGSRRGVPVTVLVVGDCPASPRLFAVWKHEHDPSRLAVQATPMTTPVHPGFFAVWKHEHNSSRLAVQATLMTPPVHPDCATLFWNWVKLFWNCKTHIQPLSPTDMIEGGCVGNGVSTAWISGVQNVIVPMGPVCWGYTIAEVALECG